MVNALRIKTRVLPGHRLAITTPELPEGDTGEVIVVSSEQSSVMLQTPEHILRVNP